MTPEHQAEWDRVRETLAAIKKRDQQKREARIARWHIAGWFTLFAVILWIAYKKF